MDQDNWLDIDKVEKEYVLQSSEVDDTTNNKYYLNVSAIETNRQKLNKLTNEEETVDYFHENDLF